MDDINSSYCCEGQKTLEPLEGIQKDIESALLVFPKLVAHPPRNLDIFRVRYIQGEE
jgi:hypothetical protein